MKDNKTIARQALLDLAENADRQQQSNLASVVEYASAVETHTEKAEKAGELADLYRRLADAINT